MQAEMFQHNYEVKLRDQQGQRTIKCDTVNQAWKAIGQMTYGGLYEVSSPTGKSTSEFIPF